MRRTLLTMAVVVMVLGACEQDNTDEVDPYDQYVANAPEGEPVLSREDAQARALLGACTDWAPGTVDAALQDAYEPDC